MFSLALFFLARQTNSNENVIPDTVTLSGEIAEVSLASVCRIQRCMQNQQDAPYRCRKLKQSTSGLAASGRKVLMTGVDDAGLSL